MGEWYRRHWVAGRERVRETTTIHIEWLVGTAAAYEIIDTDPNPSLATVGLRVEPANEGDGVV